MNITREMQWRQEEHDKLFHWDIYSLRKIDRIKHLVLHLAKYQGKYLVAQAEHDQVKKRGVVIDAIIVMMSLANTLNYALKDSSEKVPGMSYNELVIETANLCKITEAWDHMEPMNFKVEYIRSLEKLFRLWSMLPVDQDIRWRDILSRLEQIEVKSFMYMDILEKNPHLTPGTKV